MTQYKSTGRAGGELKQTTWEWLASLELKKVDLYKKKVTSVESISVGIVFIFLPGCQSMTSLTDKHPKTGSCSQYVYAGLHTCCVESLKWTIPPGLCCRWCTEHFIGHRKPYYLSAVCSRGVKNYMLQFWCSVLFECHLPLISRHLCLYVVLVLSMDGALAKRNTQNSRCQKS